MNDASREERGTTSQVTMKLSHTLFLLLALGAAEAVGAQQPRRITFNDAIAIALEQNLAVKQAKNASALRGNVRCGRWTSLRAISTQPGIVLFRLG